MTTVNGVPTAIVEKLLDNLRDLTYNVSQLNIKQETTQDTLVETSEKIAVALTKVAERLNSPPRHEELEKQLKAIDDKMLAYQKVEEEQTDLLKSTIKTIKIAAGLFGIALLIAAILVTVIEKTKTSSSTDLGPKIELLEKKMDQHIKTVIPKDNNEAKKNENN